MSINKQVKGKVGEREIKDAFIELMRKAEQSTGRTGVSENVKRNTLQSDRGGDDIVGIPLLSIEVKRQETLNVNTWWKQCLDNAIKQRAQPVLIYRQNRKAWRVVTYAVLQQPRFASMSWTRCEMTLEDFMQWYDAIYREWLWTEYGRS